MEKAVLDRWEEEYAMLWLEGQQRFVSIHRSAFPFPVVEGEHLQVEFQGDVLAQVERDEVSTEEARQRIEEKLALLRRGGHLGKGRKPE